MRIWADAPNHPTNGAAKRSAEACREVVLRLAAVAMRKVGLVFFQRLERARRRVGALNTWYRQDLKQRVRAGGCFCVCSCALEWVCAHTMLTSTLRIPTYTRHDRQERQDPVQHKMCTGFVTTRSLRLSRYSRYWATLATDLNELTSGKSCTTNLVPLQRIRA